MQNRASRGMPVFLKVTYPKQSENPVIFVMDVGKSMNCCCIKVIFNNIFHLTELKYFQFYQASKYIIIQAPHVS